MFLFSSLVFLIIHSLLRISFCLILCKNRLCFTDGVHRIASSHVLYSKSRFNGAEFLKSLEDINPRVDCSKNKLPAIYVYDDQLRDYRIDKFKPSKGVAHFTSLPYVQIEHQDKGKLIPFRDGRDILAFYANKLNSLLSNFTEWSKAYATEEINTLDHYNPLAADTYYAIVYYCAWQSESIALIRAIKQLLGRWKFLRDPPITRKKPERTIEEVWEDVYKIEEMKQKYEKELYEAKVKGLPDPPEPDYFPAEQVTFNMNIPELEMTKRILDHTSRAYNFKWWMPKFAKITYNRRFDKGFSELYNTSFKRVITPDDRMRYKLKECDPSAKTSVKSIKKPTNINFILVRLANSLMLANSRRGLKKHKKVVLAHEKEFNFNEIILKILIDQRAYYGSMPLVQLFKCVNPLQQIPSVVPDKTHEKKPFDETLIFYKPNPFDIAEKLTYGLPPLRKFTHLAVAEDFEHVGNIMNLSTLDVAKSVDEIFTPVVDLPNTNFMQRFNRTDKRSDNVTTGLEPVLYTLSIMYRYHLKKIIDARPVPVKYYYLNP